MARMPRPNFIRLVLLVSVILLAGYANQLYERILTAEILFSIRSVNWWFLGGTLAAALIGLLCLGFTFFPRQKNLIHFAERMWSFLPVHKMFGWLLWGGATFGLPLVVFGPLGERFEAGFERLFFFWIFTLIGAAGLWMLARGYSGSQLVLAVLLGNAGVYKIFTYFPEVSSYPFSLGWSETSRFYYASLFFANKVYGISTPPSVLHPTRYLMQSVPYLIAGLPLWFHRLWQVLLWIGVSVWSAIIFEKRLQIQNRPQKWLFGVWFFLFVLIGPIYYHLQIIGIIVLWGFDRQNWRKTWLAVIFASVWAGISRVNWYPVPAMLAATIYFFEIPKKEQSLWRYLVLPAVWGLVGMLTAFGSQSLYVIGSGNRAEMFTSSFTSDLLWYRLLPNTTYGMGVLLGILIFSLPPIVYLGAVTARYRRAVHWVRWLAVWAFLAVLFAGGLVVSVKIGGGSNLHNFDAFILLMGVVFGYLFYQKIAPDASHSLARPVLGQVWVVLSVVITVLLTLQTGYKPQWVNPAKVDRAFDSISTLVTEAVGRGDEVLFVTQRQLVTFDLIPNVPLIPEYENVFLMEMVMGNNRPYLDQFHRELADHRFGLIVISRLPQNYKNAEKHSWSEENNVWVERVALPILESYERVELYNEFGIEILAPAP